MASVFVVAPKQAFQGGEGGHLLQYSDHQSFLIQYTHPLPLRVYDLTARGANLREEFLWNNQIVERASRVKKFRIQYNDHNTTYIQKAGVPRD